jgi:uncharacterized protein YfaS (alpha-2-macroglobulin family)
LHYYYGKGEPMPIRGGSASSMTMAANVPMADAERTMDIKSRERPMGTGDTLVEPVIRKDFPDTVFWGPIIRTNYRGQATVRFNFPDTLTTWRATLRGITRDTKVGSARTDLVTRKNLIVRLQTPRFLTQRDQATISSITHNYLESTKVVRNVMEGDGVKLESTGVMNGSIPSGGEQRFDYLFSAPESGEAVLTSKSLTDEESDAMQLKLPILPHGTMKQYNLNGEVENEIVQSIGISEEFDPGSFTCVLTVSPSIAAAIFPALEYLAGYPYGCVEQTMSRFIPTAIVAKTVSELGVYNQKLEYRLPAMMSAGLKRLYKFQHADGGWGWWQNDSTSPYMTAYVVFGLTLAQRAGYSIDSDVFIRGKHYLEDQVQYLEDRLPLLNFILYTLSFTGEIQAEPLQRTFNNRDDLNDYQRALLAMTFFNVGDLDKGRIMLRNLMDFARIDEEHGTCSWGRTAGYYPWYEDGVEATAVALQAFTHLDPQNPVVQQIMKWLVLNRKGSKWKSSRDTAMVVYALCDYLKQSEELRPDYQLKIYLDDRLFRELNVDSGVLSREDMELDIPAHEIKGRNPNLRIVKNGRGNLYYNLNISYFTLEEDIKGVGGELTVFRTYNLLIPRVTESGMEEFRRIPLYSGEIMKSGDRIEVELRIIAYNDFEYIVVEDPKPAGMEAMELTSGHTYAGRLCANLELRDEKVAFFINSLKQGEYTITYELRAEVPGKFHGMPAKVYAMYVPEFTSISDEFRITIED